MGVRRARAEGEKPMTSEPAAQSQPTSVRARRRARIAARIAERENYFDLLASGYTRANRPPEQYGEEERARLIQKINDVAARLQSDKPEE
jgi:hypothetical protein